MHFPLFLLAIAIPAFTQASTPQTRPSITVGDSRNAALSEQKRLLLHAHKLQSALAMHKAAQAARQIEYLHASLEKLKKRQALPTNKSLGKSGNPYPSSRVIALKQRSGMADDIILLPLNQDELQASTIDLLWTIHGIEPHAITYASVRYLRQNPSPALLVLYLDKADEAIQDGLYGQARTAIHALQEQLIEPEETKDVPARLQVSDQLTMAGLLMEHQNYLAAEALLDIANNLLFMPDENDNQQTAALSDEESLQHLQNQLGDLTRQLEQPAKPYQPLPSDRLIELWAAQLDS
jgi:hypothetical protein